MAPKNQTKPSTTGKKAAPVSKKRGSASAASSSAAATETHSKKKTASAGKETEGEDAPVQRRPSIKQMAKAVTENKLSAQMLSKLVYFQAQEDRRKAALNKSRMKSEKNRKKKKALMEKPSTAHVPVAPLSHWRYSLDNEDEFVVTDKDGQPVKDEAGEVQRVGMHTTISKSAANLVLRNYLALFQAAENHERAKNKQEPIKRSFRNSTPGRTTIQVLANAMLRDMLTKSIACGRVSHHGTITPAIVTFVSALNHPSEDIFSQVPETAKKKKAEKKAVVLAKAK
jgi:hypothetical protein